MYLPEKMLQFIELTEDQIMAAYKNDSNIVVHVERWNSKKNKLEVTVGDFKGVIPIRHLTIYPINDFEIFVDKNGWLIGKNVVCKILQVDLKKKSLILSRAKAMEEAKKYFETNPIIKKAYVMKTIDKAAFIDIGFGVTGKLKLFNYTSCFFRTIEDAGCHEGKTLPVKIIGETLGNGMFKVSHKDAVLSRDKSVAINFLEKGDTIECTIGETLNDGTGAFFDYLPNVYGIVDTIRYDYLVDEKGNVCRDHAIPPLEYGRKAKVLVKSIHSDNKGKKRIRGRFINYTE